jgi:hypothetical protein
MRTTWKLAVASVALVAIAAPEAWAHHSFASQYDASKPVTIKGTITKWERINPPGWIYVDVKDPDGTVRNWAIETGALNQLARQGLGRSALPVGIEVVVRGYRAKDGSATINGNVMTLPDGRDLSLASSFDNLKKPGSGEP